MIDLTLWSVAISAAILLYKLLESNRCGIHGQCVYIGPGHGHGVSTNFF